MPRSLRIRRLLAGGAAIVLAAAGATTLVVSSAGAAPEDAGRAPADRGVLANLFEWNWKSVANECVTVLGPAGYAGVQVSQPADSISRTAPTPDAPILHPWWEIYQPVDYSLTSRMGNEAEFKAMVATCRKAGVKVYVDAVVNHMTGQGTISYGGKTFTHFNYPGLYDESDFNHSPGDCPTDRIIEDFNNYQQLTKCELVELADLRTGSPRVRTKLVSYLNKLLGYGVSGFRVDAAKHVGVEDLLAIQSQLRRTLDGDRAYMALEVFPGSPGRSSQFAFTKAGSVLGFDFSYSVKNAFKSYPTNATGNLAGLKVFGENAGLMPSDKTLVFIQNHDTERGGDTLNYKDGRTNLIANQFMLAYGYGTPQVYSGFEFTNGYDSPPSDANGYVTDTDCANGWACVIRDAGVRGMVGFHNKVGSAPVRWRYDDGQNVIAFSRGNRGFFAVNNGTSAKTFSVQTGLRRGTYRDLVHSGQTVTVDGSGRASITVAAKDAVAFTV